MPIDALEGWSEFFVAEVGATAALLGLLVVAITINLERVLAFPWLPGRAAETIGILLNALIIGGLSLIPWHSSNAYGASVLAVAVIAWLAVLAEHLRWRSLRADGGQQSVSTRIAMTQVSTVPFVVAGVLLLTSGSGTYWIAIGIMASSVMAVANAWVLMVEIRR